MTVLGVCMLVASAILAVIQATMSFRLVGLFRQPPPQLLTDEECPGVLAVLCLRGTDPFLPNTLRRLFAQDYPRYTVRVVIDSADDPAKEVVEEAIRLSDATHVEVVVLERRDEHCAAKNSSILQATRDLPEEYSFVATFDGDAMLHPSCLRELVTPLVREGAQVSNGFRWFAPPTPTVGSIARLEWNLGCVTMMHSMGLPWGGCLAMSRAVAVDPELRAIYARSFGEDMALGSYLKKRGARLAFVTPSVIVNREDISLKGLLNFLSRQMIMVRLNHHQWGWVLGFSTLMFIFICVVCPLGLFHPATRPWSIASLALLVIVLIVTMGAVGKSARNVVAKRGEDLVKMSPRTIAYMLLTLPVTQLLSLIANVRACFSKQMTWRGLTYRFANDPPVKLIREVRVTQLGREYNTLAREKAPEALDGSS